MTDSEVPPDVLVGTALQLLPVPAHADDFWTRLEHSLDAEGAPDGSASPRGPVLVAADRTIAPTSAVVPEHDPTLALVPPALRRPSNALLVAVAAAAVVVVALASSTLVRERSGSDAVASDDQPEAPADLEALVEGAHPDAGTPSTMSADGEEASSEAVMAWVADLRAGDSEEAWAAMGATSQAHFGSQSAFEEQLSSLAAGYGGWADSDPEQVLITPVLTSDEGTLAVVTLVGTVTVEGEPQPRADAIPVRVLDGKAQLEPFAGAGDLEMVVPEGVLDGEGQPSVAAGEELVVVVPSGAEAPVLRLDDGATVVCGLTEGTELSTLEETPGQRCSYLPTEGISSGEHTFTVAFLSADGTEISAQSLLFEAA